VRNHGLICANNRYFQTAKTTLLLYDWKAISSTENEFIFSLDVNRYLDNYLITVMDKLFKALNDPTRREILVLLRKKDMNAGEIADQFKISKPSISHHLDLLKQADLVLAEKNGQFVNYSLNTSVLDECLAWLVELKNKKNKSGT
jgi:DNA-binding transcriptional ArsR family regulator